MNYKNVRLDKSMYKADGGFSVQLEKMDPSSNYAGTELAELDAYQRQLKRFGIKVSGSHSSAISKFFATSDSAALFPEYVARSVASGALQENILEQIIASKSVIDSLDYRSIRATLGDFDNAEVAEGAAIPEVTIKLNDSLITMKKRGRIVKATYEAIRNQRSDVMTVSLAHVGNSLAKTQMVDAMQMLIEGDGGSIPAANIKSITGSITYDELLDLWAKFGDFEMNTIIASPKRVREILALPELRETSAGENFIANGTLVTPFGAKIVKTPAVPEEFIVAIDRRFALEMVTTGGIQVEYDKLIDTQLERAAVTTTYGFSKLFNEAVKVIELV